MTRVRDYYNINLSNLALYKLISVFCTEIITEPPEYKQLWYKVHYRRQLKSELEKRSSSDLVDINCFFKNAEEKRSEFLFNLNAKKSKRLDFEKYLEKLIKMKKILEKKERQRQQRQIQSNFCRKKKLLRV